MKIIIISALVLTFIGAWLFYSANVTSDLPKFESDQVVKRPASSLFTKDEDQLAEPVTEFKSRITKKSFGTYVTPNDSPVKPEKFTGFHTGVDVEYEDVTTEVMVQAITNGEIVFSGTINGYGGVIRQVFDWNEFTYTALYGHLDPASLAPLGTIKANEQVGVLGKGYTSETSGERKHLHFSILKGRSDNVRGYVSSENALGEWIDPLSLY